MQPRDHAIVRHRQRLSDELASLFDLRAPAAVGTAPETLDVIGGLLQGFGGTRVVMPIDHHVSVIAQPRADRQIIIFDFDEYDEKRPFTLQVSLDALRSAPLEALRTNLAEPGRRFAAPIVGVILALARRSLLDAVGGFSLSIKRSNESINQDAQLIAATLRALMTLAESSIEANTAPRDVALEAASVAAQPMASGADFDAIFSLAPDHLTANVRVVAVPITFKTDRAVLAQMAVSAKMAHHLALAKMRAFGIEAGRELISDPMAGAIGGLSMNDYKRFFRGTLPETIRGEAFLSQFGPIDGVEIEGRIEYAPQRVADHLVIESHRASEWLRYLAEAATENEPGRRKLALDKAGHLMYASHKSQRDNVGFGSDNADRLVDQIRANEIDGFFGGRLTTGGWVAILCDRSVRSDEAMARLLPADLQSASPCNTKVCTSGNRLDGIALDEKIQFDS